MRSQATNFSPRSRGFRCSRHVVVSRFNLNTLTGRQPYLPSPPTRTPTGAEPKTREKGSWLGVRRFLRTQLHLLLFTIIHAFFSLYIKIRQIFHVVRDRLYSIRRYHYRTPGFIEQDVKGLSRLPKHLSIILKLEENGRGGAELERLVNEVAEVSAWCASAGIPALTVYEKTGIPSLCQSHV